ncbi:hypothetical protein NEOLEDRAFT_645317 [Neolentinus lepideus HHB14362 ss-1]|uniref:Uncharacterized protein n=1 Tax=Neolentinus lepideus HHB14362 ss-1 TaxID=1314782 RepID=A0A165QLU5_9AGAM|nr:hypothetical protein NEOLEDRAFT_645317 [Neolentinus lepideus HHB14362 ss-1]
MTSVETIFSLGLGLGLRGLVNAVTGPNASVSGVLVGLWEGAVLHHLTNASRSLDPYIGYALRVVVDYFWTEDSQRVIIILLWTGLGMLLADRWLSVSVTEGGFHGLYIRRMLHVVIQFMLSNILYVDDILLSIQSESRYI